jgi:hypothetical protein
MLTFSPLWKSMLLQRLRYPHAQPTTYIYDTIFAERRL